MGNNKIEAVCHKPVRELESPQSGVQRAGATGLEPAVYPHDPRADRAVDT